MLASTPPVSPQKGQANMMDDHSTSVSNSQASIPSASFSGAPLNPLLARVRHTSIERTTAAGDTTRRPTTPTTPMSSKLTEPETPTTVKGILRKADTPSSSSRVGWGFRMTTEGDVSKISSLADSPTRSLIGSGSDNDKENSPLSAPASSRALQGFQNHSHSWATRDQADDDEEIAAEAYLTSLPIEASTLQNELEPDSSQVESEQSNVNFVAQNDAPLDMSSSRLRPLSREIEDTSGGEFDLMDDSLPSMAVLTPRPGSKRPVNTSKPNKPLLKQPEATPRPASTTTSQRFLPIGKQSPGSRIAKSSTESSSSSGFESSFSVNESLLAREAGKFMNQWKATESAEKQARTPAAKPKSPTPRPQGSSLGDGQSPGHPSPDKDESAVNVAAKSGFAAPADQTSGADLESPTEAKPDLEAHADTIEETGSEGRNGAENEQSVQVEESQQSFGEEDQSASRRGGLTPSESSAPRSFTTPSHVTHSESMTITAWQQDVSSHNLDTPSRARSTVSSPAVGIPSHPSSYSRSHFANELSFSTAFISSPAAQRAQRKSLKDLVQPSPLPTSKRPMSRNVSPPLAVLNASSKSNSPAPSEGALSYKTARQSQGTSPQGLESGSTPSASASRIEGGSKISPVLNRSVEPSRRLLDELNGFKRLGTVKSSVDEYIAAHEERLDTLANRAQEQESEASRLRLLLQDELEAKCEMASQLKQTRRNAEQWQRKFEMIQEEASRERESQSQSDDHLRKLVEKMREQLERRVAGNEQVAVKSERHGLAEATQDSQIAALKEQVDTERQLRAQERKDFEIRLSIAAASQESASSLRMEKNQDSSTSSSPARQSEQILEQAVRRARESAERDHEIRLYTMQRDHEAALEALEEELDGVKTQMEEEASAQAAEVANEHEQRVKELQDQIEDVKSAQKEAEELAKRHSSENDELRDGLKRAHEENEESVNRQREAVDEAERLRTRLNELEASHQEASTNNNELRAEVQELESRLASLEDERRQIEEELTAEIERRNQAWTEGLEKVEQERDDAFTLLEESDGRIQELETLASSLESDLGQRQREAEELREQLEESQASAEKLKQENQELHANAPTSSKSSSEEEIRELRHQLTDSVAQRQEDLAVRGQLEVSNQRLEDQIRHLENSLAELDELCAAQQTDLDKVEAELKEARDKQSEQAPAKGDGQDAVNTSITSRNSLEAEIKLIRLDLDEAIQAKDKATAQISHVEGLLEDMKLRNELLEKEVGDRGLSVSKLQRSNERLEQEIQNHSIALSAKQQELSLLKRKMRFSQTNAGLSMTSNTFSSQRNAHAAPTSNDTRSTVEAEQTTEILEKGPAPRRAMGRRTADPLAAAAAVREVKASRLADMGPPSASVQAPLSSVDRVINGVSKTTLGKRASPSESAKAEGRQMSSSQLSEQSAASESVRSSSVTSSRSKHSAFDLSGAQSVKSHTTLGQSDMDLVSAKDRSRTSSISSSHAMEEWNDEPTSGSQPMSLEELTRSTSTVSGRTASKDADKENESAAEATPKARTYRRAQATQQGRLLKRMDSMDSISSVASSTSAVSENRRANTKSRSSSKALSDIPGMENFLNRRMPSVPSKPLQKSRSTSPEQRRPAIRHKSMVPA
ncbi:unnamed protein product [Sympodiomycopsis kandeliae]